MTKLILAVVAASALSGQPAAPKLAFEVASIKPFVPGSGHNGFGGGKRVSVDPAMFRMRTASPEEMLLFAFDLVRWDQLEGVPEGTGAYDIDAKTPFAATEAQERVMLQALLAERFHLVCHVEKRDRKMFALVAGKDLKLQSAPEGTEASIKMSPGTNPGGIAHEVTGTTMSAFAHWLSTNSPIEGPVVDQTGLQGAFNFTLRVDSHADTNAPAPSGGRGLVTNVLIDQDSYVAALKRLGLELKPVHGPVDVLIIDHL